MARAQRKLTWDGPRYGGDIDVPHIQADAINVIALRIASAHYERQNTNRNVIGHGAAVAHHLHATDPKEWERFKQEAIDIVRALYGSGAKDLGHIGRKDTRSYFDALHDLADTLHKD